MDNEYDDILRVIESAGAEGAHPDTIRQQIVLKWGPDVMGSIMDLVNQGYIFNTQGNFALKAKGRDMLKSGGFAKVAKREKWGYRFNRGTFYMTIVILVFTGMGTCISIKEDSCNKVSNKSVDTTLPKSPHSSK